MSALVSAVAGSDAGRHRGLGCDGRKPEPERSVRAQHHDLALSGGLDFENRARLGVGRRGIGRRFDAA